MSMASDGGDVQSYSLGNPIHRMEFCVTKRIVFLVAQNLFSAVSLYAVNSKRTAMIHLIKEILIEQDELIRALISLPGQPGQLVSCSQNKKHRMMQVKFYY